MSEPQTKPAWAWVSGANRWLFAASADEVARFTYGVMIFETHLDGAKTAWCEENGFDYFLSYKPWVPAHHEFWFADAIQAVLFLFQWNGQMVPAPEEGRRA